MKVLIVAAHPDDEILGCGATTRLLTDSYNKVNVILLSKGMASRTDSKSELDRLQESMYRANKKLGVPEQQITQKDFPDNAFDSLPLLSIVKGVEDDILSFKPDIIFTHHPGDLNIDHQMTYQAVLTVCRPQPLSPKVGIYTFFIPSSSDWGDTVFSPNTFIDVERTIEYKLDALMEYITEMRPPPHSRSIESLRSFSQYWGNRSGLSFAEPFYMVRGFNLAHGKMEGRVLMQYL